MIDTGILESGFPHSSREGYDRGCKGGACPGKAEHGLSCADAVMREAGDYGFRKLIRQGKAAVEAAAIIDAPPAPPAPEPKLPREKRERKRTSTPKGPGEDRRFTPIEHGSTRGYKRGCRKQEESPSFRAGGRSCSQEMSAYQLAYRIRTGAQKAPEVKA